MRGRRDIYYTINNDNLAVKIKDTVILCHRAQNTFCILKHSSAHAYAARKAALKHVADLGALFKSERRKKKRMRIMGREEYG